MIECVHVQGARFDGPRFARRECVDLGIASDDYVRTQVRHHLAFERGGNARHIRAQRAGLAIRTH
jgi:hypothetical protein